MPLLGRRKTKALWYVLDPPRPGAVPPAQQGPYTRACIVGMLARGDLANGKLIWTNERIFPNPANPKSARPVRLLEWRRLDQIPDPVLRHLELEARLHIAANNHGNAACPGSGGNNNTHAFGADHVHHNHSLGGGPVLAVDPNDPSALVAGLSHDAGPQQIHQQQPQHGMHGIPHERNLAQSISTPPPPPPPMPIPIAVPATPQQPPPFAPPPHLAHHQQQQRHHANLFQQQQQQQRQLHHHHHQQPETTPFDAFGPSHPQGHPQQPPPPMARQLCAPLGGHLAAMQPGVPLDNNATHSPPTPPALAMQLQQPPPPPPAHALAMRQHSLPPGVVGGSPPGAGGPPPPHQPFLPHHHQQQQQHEQLPPLPPPMLPIGGRGGTPVNAHAQQQQPQQQQPIQAPPLGYPSADTNPLAVSSHAHLPPPGLNFAQHHAQQVHHQHQQQAPMSMLPSPQRQPQPLLHHPVQHFAHNAITPHMHFRDAYQPGAPPVGPYDGCHYS